MARKNQRPIMNSTKHARFAKVSYTIKSKGKTMIAEVGLKDNQGIMHVLEVLARKHFCEVIDVNLEAEPLIITNTPSKGDME
tara:strand:- start:59 stop:304 length:246 start_codon:yes stop_codon:yes gene_type:complete